MFILGLNAYHGDASAAMICDGKLVAAAEEERFTRIKHCAGFPSNAVRYCMQEAGIKPSDLSYIAIARDPKARLLKKAIYAIRIPRLALERFSAQGKFLTIKEEIANALAISMDALPAEVCRVEHHKAHLASSFFVSPFDEAALLSADGLGDFASTMWGIGRGNRMDIGGAIAFPHSLGIYYTAITQYLGFHKYGDEYKVMGLAAYGEPEFRIEFERILRTSSMSNSNGKAPHFNLNLDYFIHHRTGPEMTWREGSPVLGKLYSDFLEKRLGAGRNPGDSVETRHQNIASSLQAQLEETMFRLLNRLYEMYKVKKLCMAGGVALNCVTNGQIFRKTPFEEVYIQPAAGDAGLAIGAAYYVYHQTLNHPRQFVMEHAYFGPQYDEGRISISIKALEKSSFRILKLSEEELARRTAHKISEGKIVGWFQGRMEWGPRALGNRSILVDPRCAEMKNILNARIKHREPFRPFAPSILLERINDYFDQSYPSPFMLMTYNVKPSKIHEIPAPTHVDGTGRLQTISRSTNPLYWMLIHEFEKITGVPVLLNTSFNENEPVVNTPEEAVACFLRTRMDVLALGNYFIEKISTDEIL